MKTPERFDIEGTARLLFLAAPWFSAALAIFGVCLLFLPDGGKLRDDNFLFGFGALMALGFSAAAWYSWRIVRQLPNAAVSLDSEGIWQTSKPRDAALVRWTAVAQVTERPHLQRLELQDKSGTSLLRLEYQLENFSRLREIVLQRAALVPTKPPLGKVFSKNIVHHLSNVALLAGFLALGIYAWGTRPILGAAVLLVVVGLGGRDYLTTAYRVELRLTDLELSWPVRRLRLTRAQIVAIELSDVFTHQSRHPEVVLTHTRSPKKVSLRGFGVPAHELQRAITSWKRNS